MESLENIISGNGESVPAPETKPVEEQAAPVVEQQQAPTESADEVIEQNGRKMVPLEALTETRGKVKRYTEQVAEFERKLAEQATAFDRRMSEVLQAVRQPAPKQEPQPAPDFFADPDAAIKAALAQNLAPLESQLAETRTSLLEERLYRLAGNEKAAKIEEEIGKAMSAGDPDIQVLQQALRTRGPAAASLLVEWYDKRTFDPAAKEAEIEARVEARLRQKLGIPPDGGQPPQTQTTPPVTMPTNMVGARNVGTRSGPAWAGPTPLDGIFK